MSSRSKFAVSSKVNVRHPGRKQSSMGKRAVVGGDEMDAFSNWSHVIGGLDKAGATKKIKTNANRRDRRAWKQAFDGGVDD